MPNETDWRAAAGRVLQHYPYRVIALERVTQGLINLTLKARLVDGGQLIVQRLHPVFSDAVNHNFECVSRHLARRGLLTPRLKRTRDGALSVIDGGEVWRVMNYLDGLAPEQVSGPAHAAAAGALLARFHVALLDCDAALIFDRPAVHDFQRHLKHLREVLDMASQHRLYSAAARLAVKLEQAIASQPALLPGPPRLVHGDAKISNLLFAADGRGLCLIDLDTVARMPLCFELGDALRSWCNRGGEDNNAASFDIDRLAGAMGGYCSVPGNQFNALEQAAVLPATVQIHLELAARFLADACEERYFGWDPARYSARGEHNLARASAQLQAAGSLVAQYTQAEQRLAAVFAASASDRSSEWLEP